MSGTVDRLVDRLVDRAFLPELRELDLGLSAPRARRVGLLAEVEADLEELTRHLMASGVGAEDARARAIAALLPEGAAREELSRLHATPWVRMTRGLTAPRLRLVERICLGATAAVVLTGQLMVLRQIEMLRHASVFLWPLAGLGVLLAISIVGTVYQIWGRGDDGAGERWVVGVGGLVLIILAVGVLGGAIDLYLLLGQLQADPGRISGLALVAMGRVAALAAFALTLTLVGGIAWLVAHQRLSIVTARHSRTLGVMDHPELTSGRFR